MSLKSLLKDIAPTLSLAIGNSIAGPIGGAALKHLSQSLLGHEEGTEKQVEDVLLSSNPESLAELKKIDADFKTKMQSLGVDVQRIHAENTKSARKMASETSLWPQIILSAIFVSGYFTILILLASGMLTMPPAIKDTLILLLGVMTREMPTIMQFWFGSSAGSKKKTEKFEK